MTKSYHGTKKVNATKIIGNPNNIDVDLGSGELGKGFYTGESVSIAASWANLRFKNEEPCVLEFEKDEKKLLRLKVHHIKTRKEINELHKNLKRTNQRSNHVFNTDYVIAPFESIDSSLQYKFESNKAETFLNNIKIKVIECT